MSLPSIRKTMIDVSPAAASTTASTVLASGLGAFDCLTILAELTGATGGVLDVYLQSSWDGGTTWWDFIHFTQLAAAGAAVKYKISPSLDNVIQTVGKGATVALAANTCAGGHWGDQMRMLFVAGASTSAGATTTITIHGSNARR